MSDGGRSKAGTPAGGSTAPGTAPGTQPGTAAGTPKPGTASQRQSPNDGTPRSENGELSGSVAGEWTIWINFNLN